MITNVGFDNGHPFIEEGADDGEVTFVDDRVSVTRTAARAVSFTLDRSIDGGVTWEPVLAEVISGLGANLLDWESLSYGTTLYRAVAFTVEGATAETTIAVEARSKALWLAGGSAFGDTVRLPLNPEVEHTVSRERALKRYAGRSLPVAYAGEGVSRAVAVSGRVTDQTWMDESASPTDITRVAQLPDRLHLFRDPDGRRIYGVIGEIRMPRMLAISRSGGWNGLWGYSFTITEAT